MTIEQLKQQLINNGQDPGDFNIVVTESGYSVIPKWFYEHKQVAKKEDKPIKEDVNVVAGTIAYNLIDVSDLAETLALALIKIDSLESEIATLKGGTV